MKILVADDDKVLRELYKKVFEAESFQVDLAEDGEKAFTMLQNGGYDLALLDIQMPKMDGFKTIETLKRVPSSKPNGPIYFLTNDKNQTTIAQGIALGVSGYFIKSDYTPEQLVGEVKRILTAQQK